MPRQRRRTAEIAEEPIEAWGPRPCCANDSREVIQIHMDGVSVGIIGLNAIFQRLCEQGETREEQLGDRLVALVAVHNYVPPASRAAYRAALLAAYRAFCAQEWRHTL